MGFRTDVRLFPVQATNSAGSAVATVLDVAIASNSALTTYVTGVTVSFQNPQTADKYLQITSGATVVWKSYIPSSSHIIFPFPIRCSGDSAVTLTVSQSASAIATLEYYRE